MKPLGNFWEYVDKRNKDECWNWLAAKTTAGYGEYRVNGKVWYTHRYSWFLESGEIPDNLFVLHRCDNPSCVNPKHLFLGTHLDNLKDMRQKGRGSGPKGDKNASAKLCEADIVEIRKLFSQGNSRASIARQFKVAWHSINKVLNGKRWKWVKENHAPQTTASA